MSVNLNDKKLLMLNNFLEAETKNKPHRNFAWLFIPSYTKKINLTCTFNSSDQQYYGLSPEVSVSCIKKEMLKKESLFSDKESVVSYANKLFAKDLWKLESVPKEESIALLIKTLLTITMHFFFDIYFDSSADYRKFSEIVDGNDKNNKEKFLFLHQYECNGSTIKCRLNGRLSENIINKLEESDCGFVIENKRINISFNGKKNISELYSTQNAHFFNCTNQDFYAGVNLRLTNADFPKDDTKSVGAVLKVERTTFTTICGFDGIVRGDTIFQQNILYHPFLEDRLELLKIIIADERKLLCKLKCDLKSVKGYNCSIVKLNSYLNESIYPHYINVSANIETRDNVLVFSKRGKVTTDKGTLYCSANGVCEIYDKKVLFYRTSGTQADIPTIKHITNENIPFNGELSREIESELGVSNFCGGWEYYGFSVMWFLDTERVESCHFNVLAQNNINDNFDDVVKSWRTSTERYECDELFGYELRLFAKKRKKIYDIIKSVMNCLLNNKDLMVFTVLLTSKILEGELKTMFISSGAWEMFEWAIYFLLAVSTVMTIYNYLKKWNKVKIIRVVVDKNGCIDKIDNRFAFILRICFRKFFGKRFDKQYKDCHAITLIMALLYYYQKKTMI